MADQGSPQRRYPRYHTDLDIIAYKDQNTVRGRVRQISRGGCLIFPPLPPQFSGLLRISFRLAEGEPFINCKGEIVYSFSDKGTGIAFTEISIHNQDLITSHFEKRLAVGGAANL